MPQGWFATVGHEAIGSGRQKPRRDRRPPYRHSREHTDRRLARQFDDLRSAIGCSVKAIDGKRSLNDTLACVGAMVTDRDSGQAAGFAKRQGNKAS